MSSESRTTRTINFLRTSRGYSQGSSEALAVVMELQAERDDLQLIIDGYDRTPAEARAAVAEAQRDEARAALAAQTAAIEVLRERIALAIEADLARIKSSPFYPPDLDAAFAYRRCARIARTATS